jgi:hypothetical protein
MPAAMNASEGPVTPGGMDHSWMRNCISCGFRRYWLKEGSAKSRQRAWYDLHILHRYQVEHYGLKPRIIPRRVIA